MSARLSRPIRFDRDADVKSFVQLPAGRDHHFLLALALCAAIFLAGLVILIALAAGALA